MTKFVVADEFVVSLQHLDVEDVIGDGGSVLPPVQLHATGRGGLMRPRCGCEPSRAGPPEDHQRAPARTGAILGFMFQRNYSQKLYKTLLRLEISEISNIVFANFKHNF